MKKSLIAAAVAAVVAAPAAMADITMGGQLQAEIVSASGDGSNSGVYLTDGWEGGAGGDNKGNASAFFVKGAHKMGGLTGLYKLNFNPKYNTSDSYDAIKGQTVTSGPSIGVRDAFIGLQGGFGTVLAGRIATPYKTSTVKWDPFLATFLQARGNNGMSALHNGYADDVVAYANKFGPATVVAAVAFDESDDNPNGDGDADGDHALTASVNVPVGPVEVAIAYIDTGGIHGLVDGASDYEAAKIGVKFSSGAITVAGHYETIDQGGNDLADVMYVTGSFKAGSNTFAASYGQTSPDTGDDATYWAVGVKHAFSKKVSTLIGVTGSDNFDFSDATDDDITRFGISTRVKF